MSRKNADILLALIIVARSTSFLMSKLLLTELDPFNLLGLRFIIAFGVMAILFHKELLHGDKTSILYGVVLGLCLFAILTSELFALRHVQSSTASFLENSAIVFVPLMEAVLLRRLPNAASMICVLITFAGIGLLTVKDGSLTFHSSELLCLLAAFFYGLLIIFTDRFSKKGKPLLMGTVEIGVVGVLAMTLSLFTGNFTVPSTIPSIAMLLGLALVCTCFGFTLQPLAQKHTSAERAGMLCSLNPLTAMVLGAVFLGEIPSLINLVGTILILAGILLSYRKPATAS